MSQFERFLQQMRGQQVAVIGAGVSNTPLIELLLSAGARVTVRDKKSREALGEQYDQLAAQGASFVLGEGYLDHLAEPVIFRTPGLHPHHPALERARAGGARITSEMEVFLAVCPCPVIAVPGSDGKTTTTTLTERLLTRAGRRCHLGGNIGRPLLRDTPQMKEDDVAVLELSSFQLMTIDQRIGRAAITNVTPNHLDIHKDMEEYIGAKANIFAGQKPGDLLVLNADDPICRAYPERAPAGVRVLWFSLQGPVEQGVYLQDGIIRARVDGKEEDILPAARIRIPGIHNVANYLTAIALTWGLCRRADIVQTAEQFAGVEHRIELIREKDGVRYYNDSIASSPTRTIAGLRSFDQKVILIAGGYDKHIPYEPLALPLAQCVRHLILTGATADKIEQAARQGMEQTGERYPIERAASLEQAVQLAQRAAKPGDVVILSPASASFDQFKNFMERGETFRALVQAL